MPLPSDIVNFNPFSLAGIKASCYMAYFPPPVKIILKDDTSLSISVVHYTLPGFGSTKGLRCLGNLSHDRQIMKTLLYLLIMKTLLLNGSGPAKSMSAY